MVEVMVASMVFVAAGLGVYTIMIKAYQVVTLARYHDDARAVLQTFASQFVRLQSSDLVAGTPKNRILFTPVAAPTGHGLLWDSSMGAPDGNNVIMDSLSVEPGTAAAHTSDDGLVVTIGGSLAGIPATVTRYVQQVKEDGTTSSTELPATSAGQMFVATFTIKYSIPTLNSQRCEQSITVMRAAP